MYVKGLTLKGFKSFADPVSLDLQPGINVVVGPNGSGKSNVIDAVAWVLGAQGARALRGGKMDDVIFAGSGTRSPLGRAEVSLTIDNSDHRIPVDFSEVTIMRTLFRSGESEYAINGVPCRLLDVQELLSDSGVGRQQHVIVSQGNLDAVLSARPEDRRLLIEEAAGVLKFRKRRERSQRRLESTEANLERLQDLLREVRQQLRPLQKQAEAARRHEEVAGELQALRLYVAGRDIAALRQRLVATEAEAVGVEGHEAEIRRLLTEAEADVTAAEGAMGALSGEDLGDQVERLQGLLQRARGTSALMTERRRSLERDLSVSVSQDVVASLEADAANVRSELTAIEVEHQNLEAPLEELARAENVLATRWLGFEEQWGEGLPVADNEAASIRGELGALNKTLASLVDDIDANNSELEQIDAARQDAATELARLKGELSSAEAQIQVSRQELIDLQDRVSEATAAYSEAEARFHELERRASAAAARAESIAASMNSSRAKAGAEHLAEVKGIIGTLNELVEVDDGYQDAFDAVAGDAMGAVVMDSANSARSALKLLEKGDVAAGVLVLGQAHYADGTDSQDAPLKARMFGQKAKPLRPLVKGTSPAVDQLLDAMLARSFVVDGGWEAATDFAVKFPDIVVVTQTGARFSNAHWRSGSVGSGATLASARQAEQEMQRITAEFEEARTHLEGLQVTRDELVGREQSTRQSVVEGERRLVEIGNLVERQEAKGSAAQSESERLRRRIAELSELHNNQEQRVRLLEERLPVLEAAEASGAERAHAWREQRSVLENRSTELRSSRSELEVKASALQERSTYLTNRLETLEARLGEHKNQVEEAGERRSTIERSITVLDRLQNLLVSRLEVIETQLGEVRRRRDKEREHRRSISDRLEEARRRRSSLERELLENNESKQQLELKRAEVRVRLETVLETVERELDVDVETAIEAPEPALPDDRTPKQRMIEIERELRQMGPVNALALEEFDAVKERHDFLDKQLRDVQESRRELVRVIRAVDAEIVDTFQSAYLDVVRNFEYLFSTLFPDGAGQLRLTDPQNLLETGIEIEAKPSGKNIRALSLLSGGERSLAAMAFLFAVFRSRPSPFYLLDEVEAALDDINLDRFLALIEEFRNDAQLVIVSHQKRTMERADCLYGVSMRAGGSSKIVSERVHLDLTATA